MSFEGVLIALIFMVGFAAGQAVLPSDEVEGLRAVGRTLGKKDWDFTVDPCSGSSGWFTPNPDPNDKKWTPDNAVVCDCSYDSNTTCHVIRIRLRVQNLGGTLPAELTRFPFLEEIDLTRNYLNGTIPKEWGSTKLRIISLLGNRITGTIPKELGNITTLEELVVEHNQLNGTIPPELGNLARIRRLLFASNNLTGELPASLAKLTTLAEFRVSSNNFMGQIPDFIQNWTHIDKLMIQGSGLAGPIPPGIALLTNLTDLRISDLSGNDSTFPDLSNMKKLKTLILRSCNIGGQLPDFLGKMNTEELKILDLSFNKLTGLIPENFSSLSPVDYIYFTGNSLTGRVPNWMLNTGEAIDLSYNNLTDGQDKRCQPTKTNLFASSKGQTTGIVSCLRSYGCSKNYSSVYINCGGTHVVDESNSYETDSDSGGPSNFYYSQTNWAYSNTGHFLDDGIAVDSFIQSNNSSISGPNTQLYENARLSALSLTYYAFCLINGNYTVNLHFAEIMFTNDSTYSSLGRRLFDVYIQGKLVLKDFNIQNEAGGVNMGIRKKFTVVVDDHALDIRFYWAGKGTTDIPKRGVYGPLISAISIVNPNAPRSEEDKNGDGMPVGAIVGIVVAVLLMMFLVLGILWWKGCLWRDDSLHDLKDLHAGSLSLRQIKAATNNFDPANKIGEGGFGPVYKGFLLDGTVIAVKQLSSKSKQGNREFLNEIGMISALQHPHLVKLYGCCIEANQLLLVYEYMENNSLARALFGPKDTQLHLDWATRQKICIGIARGLAFLHEESRLKIVHRDIKATNVLLDKNLVPKISDFGLAKLDEEDETHISTRVAGTYGYMAPEYAMRGHLTDKADVYSFGVVVLEIVCGRSNTSIKPKEASFYLLDWAKSLKEIGDLLELVDPRLASNFNRKEVMTAINVALMCTNVVAAERPSMSTVVSMLEGKGGSSVDELIPGTSFSGDEMSGGDEQSVLMDVPWTASSASTRDLYPISVNSEYWNKRDP